MIPYFQTEGCTLYHTDVLEADIPSCSIDLIVTSPPYNVGIEYSSYEDSKALDEYLEFSRSWLTRCWEWLKPDGRICINVALDTTTPTPFSLGATMTTLAQEVGFRLGFLVKRLCAVCDGAGRGDYSALQGALAEAI